MKLYNKLPFNPLGKKGKTHQKYLRFNSELYVDFIMDTMRGIADLPDGYQYNALAWTANRVTIDYLREHIDSMIWLAYSPRCDETLSDHEYEIDEKQMFEVKA
jgi:hypothetical protein